MSAIINDATLSRAWADIAQELQRSKRLHPHYTTDPLRQIALIGEELGEALRLALDLTRPPRNTDDSTYTATLRLHLYRETVEVAVMALLALSAMRTGGEEYGNA